jgi:8-oxo-dGTP pyrophosphatase MutT (NUDIX family)
VEVSLDPQLINAQDLIVVADYGQLYIWPYSTAPPDEVDDDDDDVALAALDDARESGRFVGVRPGFIDVLIPGGHNFHTPLRLEVWSAEPPDDREDWDHEVDADLDVPEGLLLIAGPPAHTKTEVIEANVPADSYRVRISGRGFTELGTAGADGDDSYRLRLWPRSQVNAPVLRKRWQGWDRYFVGTDQLEPTGARPAPGGESLDHRPGFPDVDEFQSPAGETAERDVVERPGVAVVVALDAADRVLLVSSHSVGDAFIELPACPLDDAEDDPLEAARRDLLAEAGLRADTWNTLVDLPALPGEMNKPSRVYLARDLHPVPESTRIRTRRNDRHDEADLRSTWVTLDQAVDDVFAGVIRNGVAAAAIAAIATARDTVWAALRPADLPWRSETGLKACVSDCVSGPDHAGRDGPAGRVP